jgi:hypothetical protein
MVRTFLKVCMELGSYFISARTNKRHHHHRGKMSVVSLCEDVVYAPTGNGWAHSALGWANGSDGDAGSPTASPRARPPRGAWTLSCETLS